MKKIAILLLLALNFNMYSQDIKFGKVSKTELEEQYHPLDSTANASYLFKKRRSYYEHDIDDGFYIITEIHERIKIYNKKGLEYANKYITFRKPDSGDDDKVTNIKAFTFNLNNGQINKTKLSNNQVFEEKNSKYYSQKKIAFPNVTTGSVIDLKYKKRSNYRAYIDDLKIQSEIPTKLFIAKIEIPEYFNFKKHQIGFLPIRINESSKNRTMNYSYYVTINKPLTPPSKEKRNESISFLEKVFEINEKNIPAIDKKEPYVYNIDNYKSGLKFELSYTKFPNSTMKFYATSWEDVSKKIHQFSYFGSELTKTAYFKKDLESLLPNLTSEHDKVIGIFEFVKSKVKWNNTYGKYTDLGVRKAYKEGTGNVADINLMLTAMLREAGLNANPVLVSSKNNGIPVFPTMDGFNYVIAMVELKDNSSVLLDATSSYNSPNSLPVRAINWKGRKVTKDGISNWVELTPNNHATVDHKIFAKIDKENNINGLIKSTYKNSANLFKRTRNQYKKNDAVIATLEEENAIEIGDFRVNNKDNIYKPFGYTYKFSSDDLIEEINNKLYIHPLLSMTTLENPFKSNDRHFPIDFLTPWVDKISTSITIPENYKVESLPEPLAIGLPNNIGVFKYQVSTKNNKINTLMILQFNSGIIGHQYYTLVKEFYSTVVAKQMEKIVLTK